MAIAVDSSVLTTQGSSFPWSRCRFAAAMLILGTTIVRLVYLAFFCPLDLAPDEAHYWDWSRHLDWSYYSKGPLVAWLIRASCTVFGDTMLAVRLPAALCGGLLLTGLYVLTFLVHRSDRLALTVTALALTLPVIHVGGMLMTIDAPFTCCWCWAAVIGHQAAVARRNSAWPVLGIVVGLGILAKSTMVLFLPMLALFLVQRDGGKGLLGNRGFWIAIGIAGVLCTPIVAWNAVHGWVTLRHAQGHAGLSAGTPLVQWLGPLRFLAMQFGLLLGYWFLVWSAAMWAHRPWREQRAELRFLWWMSAPMFLFFGLISLKNGGGEANWPVAAYLAGMVLAAGWLAQRWRLARPLERGAIAGLVSVFAGLGLLTTALVHDSRWATPVLARLAGPETHEHPLPLRRWDPTCRLKGWQALAREIDSCRRRCRENGIEPVLAAGAWNIPGEISFYGKGHPLVYNLGPLLGGRRSQYDLWRPNPVADPEVFHGRAFILVGVPPARADEWFERVRHSYAFTYYENGHAMAAWQITVAEGFRGSSQAVPVGW